MSYNKPNDKPALKQRVATNERMIQLALMQIQEIGSQAHWMLTILKDMPEWQAAIEKAKEAMEKAKEMAEKAAEENEASPEIGPKLEEEKKGLDLE